MVILLKNFMENKENFIKCKRKKFTPTERDEIWSKFFNGLNSKCFCCQRDLIKNDKATWHIAHITSLAKGGTNDMNNLKICCVTCNSTMSSKNMSEWLIKKISETNKNVFKIALNELNKQNS